ncbi:MAG: FecR domain-containing protein [Bacteriovoracaceae bacterium]|nr:FecR domain-containing protein [Bacteriovoracaceae bacterium]
MFKIFSFFLTFLISYSIWASPHVGIIVKLQGQAQLLTNPAHKPSGSGKSILFEGVYYDLMKARLGTKVKNGNILRTGNGAKAKVVFKNGDQFLVGEGSAYKISWARKKKQNKEQTTVELMYGAIRGVVDKDGPRHNSRVKTKDAVMGIRGTDFHIWQQGTSGDSQLSVLRGQVELKTKKDNKSLKVEKGFSAEVAKSGKSNKLSLLKTTKTDLIKIHKDSRIEKPTKVTNKKLAAQITTLEKKASQTVLKDIKNYDPKLYKVLKSKKIEDTDQINKIVVGKVFVKAPKKKKKIGVDSLNLDEDAYEKYFRVDDL